VEEKQMATTLSRRNWLSWSAGALTVSIFGRLFDHEKMLTKPIPSSGEQLPVIGLGSSATFAEVARSEDVGALREVMTTLVQNGGTIFDTAPDYGASELVAGRIAREASITDKIFWATKVNVAREAVRPTLLPRRHSSTRHSGKSRSPKSTSFRSTI
jgi:aryl-alcohol dehydrogenase-like predicted oxidoreductase